MNEINQSIYDNLELWPLDLQGWNGNHPLFGNLINEIKPSLIIEVGSWKGQSSINMAESVKKAQLNTKIICVDTWLGALEFWSGQGSPSEYSLHLKNGYPQVYYQFLSNVVHTNNQQIILPFPCPSSIAAKNLLKKNVVADLIYIDASHEEEDVYSDIINYWKLLRGDGIMFGDDYHSFWPGVQNAVNRFAEENQLECQNIEGNFWLLRKSWNP